ncbi:MAG: hypothetical protein PVJ01_05640, partial [Pseudomonadota bacterium]
MKNLKKLFQVPSIYLSLALVGICTGSNVSQASIRLPAGDRGLVLIPDDRSILSLHMDAGGCAAVFAAGPAQCLVGNSGRDGQAKNPGNVPQRWPYGMEQAEHETASDTPVIDPVRPKGREENTDERERISADTPFKLVTHVLGSHAGIVTRPVTAV